MPVSRVQPGPLMSQAVIHNGVVYLAGQVAEGDSVTVQTGLILGKIDALLAAAGSSKDAILTATIWLTEMAEFAAMNEVWKAWLPPGAAPARATVAAELAYPVYRVEIMVTAAVA